MMMGGRTKAMLGNKLWGPTKSDHLAVSFFLDAWPSCVVRLWFNFCSNFVCYAGINSEIYVTELLLAPETRGLFGLNCQCISM